MRAQVPVPQGERSITPVHVEGRLQSSSPVETVTALRMWELGCAGGPESWPVPALSIQWEGDGTTGDIALATSG